MGNFGTLNWTILLVYVCGNLLLGYYVSKRISTASHFYLGNRMTPWWVDRHLGHRNLCQRAVVSRGTVVGLYRWFFSHCAARELPDRDLCRHHAVLAVLLQRRGRIDL